MVLVSFVISVQLLLPVMLGLGLLGVVWWVLLLFGVVVVQIACVVVSLWVVDWLMQRLLWVLHLGDLLVWCC